MNSHLTDALKTLWADAPVGDTQLQLLELEHSALEDEHGNVGSIRLVNAVADPVTVTLETGADATFYPGGFSAKLPDKGVQGQRVIDLAIDGASREGIRQLERIADAPKEELKVTYREYASTDLSTPGLVYKGLTLETINASPLRVTGSAIYNDSVNKLFPSINYRRETHPSL